MKSFFKKVNKKNCIAKIKRNNGFLMIEILIAISIIVASVFSAMAVSSRAILVSHQSVHISQASFLLEEGAEVVRIIRDNSWDNISSLDNLTTYYPVYADSAWSLSAIPSQVGIFTRTITISSVNRDSATGDISDSGTDDPGTKLVTVNVSWQEGSKNMSKSLSFYISNIFL
ncbi:MAG TPA: hypothetical protein PKZ36_01470 [Candidatus Paceibacterota bacterium]|nr:hypothetical protein [Candidatus Paceibacterota bacterium]HPT18056.1 hypothetical protein [Candidatus Paceibacterota bacterium]